MDVYRADNHQVSAATSEDNRILDTPVSAAGSTVTLSQKRPPETDAAQPNAPTEGKSGERAFVGISPLPLNARAEAARKLLIRRSLNYRPKSSRRSSRT